MAFRAGVEGPDRAQGFGQHHADPAVQQAEGLLGARIHGHPAHQVVVAFFGDFDAQMAHRTTVVAGVHFFQAGLLLPDRHGALSPCS